MSKQANAPLASYSPLPPIAGQIFAVSDRDPCVCPNQVGWLTRATVVLPQVLEPSFAACRRPGCKVKGGSGSPNSGASCLSRNLIFGIPSVP